MKRAKFWELALAFVACMPATAPNRASTPPSSAPSGEGRCAHAREQWGAVVREQTTCAEDGECSCFPDPFVESAVVIVASRHLLALEGIQREVEAAACPRSALPVASGCEARCAKGRCVNTSPNRYR